MTDRQFWQLAYVSVLAIRLHPRNDSGDFEEDVEEAASLARQAAEAALRDSVERFAPLST